jgi:hypothetical protein
MSHHPKIWEGCAWAGRSWGPWGRDGNWDSGLRMGIEIEVF